MNNILDKDLFKAINRECSEYADEMSEAFPYWVMKIYFPQLTEDEIDNALSGLDRNDDSIDGFFVSPEKQEIYIIQVKSVLSEKQIKPCKKEWLSYLYDVPNKLTNTTYVDNHKNYRIKEISADYIEAVKKEL